MPRSGLPLALLGLALLLGVAADVLGKRAHVPRVSLLLGLGAALGPVGFDLVPMDLSPYFPSLTQIVLSLVGFQLGGHFHRKVLGGHSAEVLAISLAASVVPSLLVLSALVLVGAPLQLAMLFAAVAAATDAAATLDVVRGSGDEGLFGDTLLQIVAIDDAWGVLIFSVLVAALELGTGGSGAVAVALHGAWEVLGGLALGALFGLPMAWLASRLRGGELQLLEAIGFVLLVGGASELLGVSYLLSSMAMGAVVVNRKGDHRGTFTIVEQTTEPFLVVFFLLAGYNFELTDLRGVAGFAALYAGARIAGKLLGSAFGARVGGAPAALRRWMGWCLLPQGGVALGLGLVAAERFPEHGSAFLSALVATTVFFELLGPLAARWALARATAAS